jgi:hypothetical protein
MPCRHANRGRRSDRGIDDRNFRRTALAIGGPEALSALVERNGDGVPAGGPPTDRGGHQHAWGVEAGSYHLLLALDYRMETVDPAARARIERALSSLEAVFGWGPGGVAFALGYSPAYVRRYDVDPPAVVRQALGVESGTASTVSDGGGTDDSDPDASLHLASDDASVLLAAEAALWGESVPAVELDATVEGVLSRPREPPARRAAVAREGWTAPDGSPVVEGRNGRSVGVVRQIRPERAATARDAGDSSGCPVHGNGGDDRDGDGDGERNGNGNGDGGWPDTTTREASGGPLLGLRPDGPRRIELELTALSGDADGQESRTERYLVPPLSERSLPWSRNRDGYTVGHN